MPKGRFCAFALGADPLIIFKSTHQKVPDNVPGCHRFALMGASVNEIDLDAVERAERVAGS